MKNLIYQFWDGELTPGNETGHKIMKEYANRINADYIFEINPRWQSNLGTYTPHYGAFKPIFDETMKKYDYVLFADTDVIPVEGLQENIFEQFYNTDVELGICEEWNQPAERAKKDGSIGITNDNAWCKLVESKWNIKMPKTPEGWLRIFNSGVVVYSNKGMEKFRNKFFKFHKYVDMIQKAKLPAFYECDQPYLHAMLEVCQFNWTVMDYKWNSSVHYGKGNPKKKRPVIDLRNKDTNFVHVQLAAADHYSHSRTWKVVNLPVSQWD